MGDKFILFDDKELSLDKKKDDKHSLFSDTEIKNLIKNGNQSNFYYKEKPVSFSQSNPKWKVLIVDDEDDVIAITKLALYNFEYDNKKIHFFEANSGDEAKKILLENDDIALIFLDVVMKTNNDGLELAKYIRDSLNNKIVQIILRTGQPGIVPEKDIISNYSINYYQTKAELTESKLYTITASTLRAYNALKTVGNYNKNLENIIEKRTGELLLKNEALKKADITKNKMLSIIAHDLVNPFNSILGFSSILKDKIDNFDKEKIKQYAEIIYQTSENTYNLLSNLLEWSRTQTGNIKYIPKKVLINDLIKSNITLLQSQADKKSLILNYDSQEKIYAFCDQNMINTTIRNIISNGIKFTEKGGIKIISDIAENQCLITIQDTGIGIKNDNVKHLFSFEKDSSFGTAGETGSGIGLMLCNEFIEINNGNITVESEVNKGSTFFIRLPLFKD